MTGGRPKLKTEICEVCEAPYVSHDPSSALYDEDRGAICDQCYEYKRFMNKVGLFAIAGIGLFIITSFSIVLDMFYP